MYMGVSLYLDRGVYSMCMTVGGDRRLLAYMKS
jgi:hypothetical protein